MQKIQSWQVYIWSFFTLRAQMKFFGVHNVIWEAYYYSFYSVAPSLVSTFIWLSIFTLWQYLVFIICSYSVPTRYYSALLGSYSVHIILCTKLWWFCAVISIKPTTKKTRNETIQNKKNAYYKNILIEVLNKKDKEKKRKTCFFFILAVLILYFIWLLEKVDLYLKCTKNLIFYGLSFIELNIFSCIKSGPFYDPRMFWRGQPPLHATKWNKNCLKNVRK